MFFSGCSRERLFIYSKDQKQCITVITNKREKIRFIIAGKHHSIPKEDYIKVDIRKIDPLGDGVWGCWNGSEGWELAVEKAVVIENKLDTSKFKFNDKLPRDDWGVPREAKYKEKDCFIYDFLSNGIEGNGTIK